MFTAEQLNQIAQQRDNPVEQAAIARNTAYSPMMSDQLDAQMEYAKHEAAFSQPRNDLVFAHSANYDAIVAQYQQQHYNTVSSGGTYQQTPESHARFIQQQGYVTEDYSNRPQYDRYGNPTNSLARAEAAARGSGYQTPLQYSGLGDLTTGRFVQTFEQARPALIAMGLNAPSTYDFTGRVLERQREQAYITPGTRDDQFFNNELQKWISVPIDESRIYHHEAQASGLQVAANPYEYQGDLAVEFLKGAPARASEMFSPVSGLMSQFLPGGQGVQQDAWNRAIGGERTPAPVSYTPALDFFMGAAGKYGPYAVLYGGPEYNPKNDIPAPASREQYFDAGISQPTIRPIQEPTLQYQSPFVSSPYSPNLFGETVGRGVQFAINIPRMIEGGVPLFDTSLSAIRATAPSDRLSYQNSTTVSGGNETITNLGNWIDRNRDKVDTYNLTQVGEYNSAVAVYNNMSRENPVVTTSKSISTSTNPMGGKPEGNFFDNLAGAFRGAVAWTPLGATLFGTEQEKASAYARGESLNRFTGATVGMIATPELGPMESILGGGGRLAGEYLTPQLLKAGVIAGGVTAGIYGARELYENQPQIGLPTVPGLPKISDVIPSQVYNAPGQGYDIVANVPGRGFGIIAGLPGAGREAIAKTESVAGGFFGGIAGGVIELPKATIDAYDVVKPYVIAPFVVSTRLVTEGYAAVERPVYDLYASANAAITRPTSTGNVIEYPKPFISAYDVIRPNVISEPDYALKEAAAASTVEDRARFDLSVKSRAEELPSTKNLLAVDFATDYANASSLINSRSSSNAYPIPFVSSFSESAIASKINQQIATRNPVLPQTITEPRYDIINGGGPRPPIKPDIRGGILPNLGGGGGGAPGFFNPRRGFKFTEYLGITLPLRSMRFELTRTKPRASRVKAEKRVAANRKARR